MQNIDEIEELIKLIAKLPGLGPKSAKRIVLKLINNRDELVKSAKKVFDAVLSEKFTVEIFKRYSLSDAKKAHEKLEAKLLTGPAVIIPN